MNFVTPHYAAHWRTIGIQLYITCGKLDAIEQEHPSDTFRCCNKMLEQWLEEDENASWQQLITTIISFKRVRTFHKKGLCASYGTAQFKLYTCVQVHACACTFNACKTSKTGVCMYCCMWFWRAHMGKQTHTTHKRCTS